jgi:hypothetical protein
MSRLIKTPSLLIPERESGDPAYGDQLNVLFQMGNRGGLPERYVGPLPPLSYLAIFCQKSRIYSRSGSSNDCTNLFKIGFSNPYHSFGSSPKVFSRSNLLNISSQSLFSPSKVTEGKPQSSEQVYVKYFCIALIMIMLAVAWSDFFVVVKEGMNHVRNEGSMIFPYMPHPRCSYLQRPVRAVSDPHEPRTYFASLRHER